MEPIDNAPAFLVDRKRNSISERTHQISVHGFVAQTGMIIGMDDPEIERLRKSIRRTFAGQPHKVKYWLALLDMFGRSAGSGEVPGAVLRMSAVQQVPTGERRLETRAHVPCHSCILLWF